MKKAMLILLSVAAYTFSLNDVSVPNKFNPSTPARSSEVNANFDTLASRINQNNDTIEQKFIRFSDLESGDSILEKCRIDTARIDHIRSNPEADSMTITKVDINGGTIDGTVIGANSAAAGTFTTVTASGVDINGGTIDGTVIGANSAAAGTFTTVTASGALVNGKLVLGTRPDNEHRWTLALDQHNTLWGLPSATLNIMHNLYYDGSNWRYRYGSGSKSGGVVTTLAYNQFSVQVADDGVADSIATLTPAIYTNLNGNTAFGKNTFVGGNRLEVEGNTLVNGTLKANNSFVGQASAVAKHYHDVLSYDDVGAITGTMKITMPKSWSNTMMSVTIKGYTLKDNNTNGWECRVHGYNFTTGWVRLSAQITGNAPFSKVRLAHDGTKCIILLGETSTVWNYPKLTVSEMLAGHQNTDGWETGWNASIITSETGIGNVVTPPTSIYGNNAVVPGDARIDDTLWVGTTNATKLYDGWYLEGSYLCTLSGFTSLVTCTTYYVKCGKAVTLTFSTATGTSNDYDILISTGLMPASIRPARKMYWKLCRWSFTDGLQTTEPVFYYTIPNNVFRITSFQSQGLKSISNSFSINYSTY